MVRHKYKFYADGIEIDTPESPESATRCLKGYEDSKVQLFQLIDVTSVTDEAHLGFEYVPILSNGTDGMEGWINLFFNGEIIALVNNEYLATQIKQSIPAMKLKQSRLTIVEGDKQELAP